MLLVERKFVAMLDILRFRRMQQVIGVLLVFAAFTMITYQLLSSPGLRTQEVVEVSAESSQYIYDTNSPLIFIGGFPRSGTTLMRAMLDAHPDIRCGQETRVAVRIVNFIKSLSKMEMKRMAEGGVTSEIVNRALAAFLLEIIVHHGEAAKRLCNKDPFLMSVSQYVHDMFPNSKFIFMVRDGRASIYSAISRNVTIGGYNYSDPESCLKKWDSTVRDMYDQCTGLGRDTCMIVYYEQLVLHPTHWLPKILRFLDVPWDNVVLHHEREINRPGGVKLSRHEKSSDQVIKPVNAEALSKWAGFYSDAIVAKMATIAPMLSVLGYDPDTNTPNYGSPEDTVLKNTKIIQNQIKFWEEQAMKLHLNEKPTVSKEDDSKGR